MCQLAFLKKKKNQVKSPSPESRVPETGSDPPIGSDRDSGRDRYKQNLGFFFILGSWSRINLLLKIFFLSLRLIEDA